MSIDGLSMALAGETVAFAPYVWRALPEFVQSKSPERWWLDVDFCQRALTDAAGVCQADGLLVPLVDEHAQATMRKRTEDPADIAAEIVHLDELQPGLEILDLMAAVGRYGMVAVLPTLEDLGRLLPEGEPEDAEDALCDLARAALDRRARAVAVRGTALDDVRASVTQITKVARYFGAQALGITAAEAWSSGGRAPVHVLTVGQPWPTVPRGVVTTFADMGENWTATEIRELIAQRGSKR